MSRNGIAGSLYLTNAPATGVVHPIIKYKYIVKDSSSPAVFFSLKFNFRIYIHPIINKLKIIMFSKLLIYMIGVAFQIKGLNKLFIRASGALVINVITDLSCLDISK